METDLLDRRARTRIGGAILTARAFSRNFHVMGTLLAQHMWETSKWASSVDGRTTPAELSIEESWIAHNSGSVPLAWAPLVTSKALSHRLCCTESDMIDYTGQICESFMKNMICWRIKIERLRSSVWNFELFMLGLERARVSSGGGNVLALNFGFLFWLIKKEFLFFFF